MCLYITDLHSSRTRSHKTRDKEFLQVKVINLIYMYIQQCVYICCALCMMLLVCIKLCVRYCCALWPCAVSMMLRVSTCKLYVWVCNIFQLFLYRSLPFSFFRTNSSAEKLKKKHSVWCGTSVYWRLHYTCVFCYNNQINLQSTTRM